MAHSAFLQPPAIDSQPALGSIINQYRIEELLGSGASGTVFRAYDLRLRRQVAVKLLRHELQADQVAWGRMLHEARATSRLNHRGFCAIYEVTEEQGQAYIAMEYVSGRSLKQVLAGSALSKELVLLYGTQLAAALAYAHERGIIHRDIKSSNVIIQANGGVKLLDLGLASRLPRKKQVGNYISSATLEAEQAGGILPYSAPEILRGERPSVQSDIWALGTLLYEMSTAALPFTGRTYFEVSLAIMTQSYPPPPRQIGRRLAAVIQRCLQKDCALRYAAAHEIRDDMRRMLLTSHQGRSSVLWSLG
jgi:serine/threonine-protein kinase